MGKHEQITNKLTKPVDMVWYDFNSLKIQAFRVYVKASFEKVESHCMRKRLRKIILLNKIGKLKFKY